MGIARSTYYDEPTISRSATRTRRDDGGDCRVPSSLRLPARAAALRHRGLLVNHKKVIRLMREHGLAEGPAAICGHHRQRP